MILRRYQTNWLTITLTITLLLAIYQLYSVKLKYQHLLTQYQKQGTQSQDIKKLFVNFSITGERNNYVFERLNGIVESKFFQELIERKADHTDSDVIRLIRSMMDPPSKRMRKHSSAPVSTPQSVVMQEIIDPQKHKGFFIECGALDGERSSNTNYLEDKYKWTGLLIEADPSYYTQILGKNRKSWSINACLSPYPYTSFIEFAEHPYGQGHLSMDGIKGPYSSSVFKVPCFTLESLLQALNRTTVDFFSLDVEGAELGIINNTNFERLDIKTMTVEYIHVQGGKEGLITYLKEKGMKFYKEISMPQKYIQDLFFVKATN